MNLDLNLHNINHVTALCFIIKGAMRRRDTQNKCLEKIEDAKMKDV